MGIWILIISQLFTNSTSYDQPDRPLIFAEEEWSAGDTINRVSKDGLPYGYWEFEHEFWYLGLPFNNIKTLKSIFQIYIDTNALNSNVSFMVLNPKSGILLHRETKSCSSCFIAELRKRVEELSIEEVKSERYLGLCIENALGRVNYIERDIYYKNGGIWREFRRVDSLDGFPIQNEVIKEYRRSRESPNLKIKTVVAEGYGSYVTYYKRNGTVRKVVRSKEQIIELYKNSIDGRQKPMRRKGRVRTD